MKQPTVQEMKSLLLAAAILTELQTLQDNSSIDIAYNMWAYIDNIRSQYPELKNVLLPL